MKTPRRWGLGLGAAALLLSACGDDEGLSPQLRAPEIGSYVYEAIVHTAEGEPADTFVGELLVAVSSEDSIVGSWNVDGYGDGARGIWNVNAYALLADPQPPVQGTITHRVWRQSSGTIRCNLTYQRISMPADTFTTTAENSCSLERD